MKYIYIVSNEVHSTFFEWKIEDSYRYEFEVHVFARKEQFSELIKVKWLKLHEAKDPDRPDDLFFDLLVVLLKQSWWYSDELILISSNESRSNQVFDTLVTSSTGFQKARCAWKSANSQLSLSSFFPENQVCSTCKTIFLDQSSKKRHEERKCSYCGESECCADRERHQKIRHNACEQVGCNETFRSCCPSDLNQHLQTHPECSTCKERFYSLSPSYYYSKTSLQAHIKEMTCRHCKKMTCIGKKHSMVSWQVCSDVKCPHEFADCMTEQNRAHLSTHPKCDCGCEKHFFSEQELKLHKYPFRCNEGDCKIICRTSTAWFQHSDEENHLLLCSCRSCSSKPKGYFAKPSKMKKHLKETGFSCNYCKEFFYTDEALGYHKAKCSKNPKPTTVLTWGEIDDKLVKVVNENLSIVDYPMWTLTNQEKEDLRALRNEIQNKLSSAKLFQLRVQGSMIKNTAIPAMADFDFILEIRDSKTTLPQVKKEIINLMKDLHCGFCYGEGQIQTWLTFEKSILFDLVLKFPNDSRFQDFENNVHLVKSQATNIHSYIRGLKYWCKRSNAPIKSFLVEFIGIKLFSNNSPVDFTAFLRFLQKNDWIREVVGLVRDFVEPPNSVDLKKLQDLATRALTALVAAGK